MGNLALLCSLDALPEVTAAVQKVDELLPFTKQVCHSFFNCEVAPLDMITTIRMEPTNLLGGVTAHRGQVLECRQWWHCGL